ncbi:MAG: CinA family protein [Oscillospiraceae bacterium]|nr:CinA family protein [Candidatus Limimonas coprohippi]
MDFEMVHFDKRIRDWEINLPAIAKEVVDLLKERGQFVSFAESCTGGLIAKCITDVPGASNVFECGIVSYSNDIKKKILGVSTNLLDEEGPVNAETAVQMAVGVKKVADADIGIGVTGVAGPGFDGGHPEGEIYIGLVAGGDSYALALNTGTTNKRDYNRQFAAYMALRLAKAYLENKLEDI